jgi:hypothetical protein
MLTKVRYSVIMCLVVAVLSACGHPADFSSVETNSGLTRVSALELYDAFRKDSTQAEKEWNRREVEVFGTVRSIGREGWDANTTIEFDTGQFRANNNVVCSLDREPARLGKGKRLLVRGKIVHSSTIQLLDCEVLAP